MLSILKTILSIFLSLYFFFAGTGFNIIDFCCDFCESAGIELCMHQHSNSTNEQKNHLCELEKECNEESDCVEQHCTGQCKVIRLQVETPEFSKGYTCNCHSCDLKHLLFANDLFLPNKLSSENDNQKVIFVPSKIHFTGRDVLICKAVLLI